MNANEQAAASYKNLQKVGIGLAIIGIVALGVGFAGGRGPALQSYLFAYIFWLGITLGCFGLTLLHHMIRGRWAKPILRMAEAGGGPINLILMAALLLPILVFLPELYPWANSGAAGAGTEMAHQIELKRAYLNQPFFFVRLAFYFVVWVVFASVLRRSSIAQDRTGDSAEMDRRASIAAPGVVVFVLTVTFSFIDLVMSLDPRWSSTLYGLWFVVSHGLGAMALLTMIAMWLKDRAPYSDVITPVFTRDAGNVMLAFTMFWGYFSLSQFLIIYSGNLPEEITYYMDRMSGFWQALGTFLVIGQFFIPFTALLSGKAKRTPRLLFLVAAGIFVMRILDHFWTIVPFFLHGSHGASIASYWVAIPAFLGVGGIWLVAFTAVVVKAPVLPRHEVVLQEAFDHA